MKIYFAGSIRGGRADKDKYFEIIDFLSRQAEVLTEHVGSRSLGSEGEKQLHDDEICRRDLNWLSRADAVIAEVSQPSLGVGYEIGVAEKIGKPILCLFDERLFSFEIGHPNQSMSKEAKNYKKRRCTSGSWANLSHVEKNAPA